MAVIGTPEMKYMLGTTRCDRPTRTIPLSSAGAAAPLRDLAVESVPPRTPPFAPSSPPTSFIAIVKQVVTSDRARDGATLVDLAHHVFHRLAHLRQKARGDRDGVDSAEGGALPNSWNNRGPCLQAAEGEGECALHRPQRHGTEAETVVPFNLTVKAAHDLSHFLQGGKLAWSGKVEDTLA